MTQMFAKATPTPPPAPTPLPPPTMPDPGSPEVMAAQRRTVAEAQQRSGRTSTILTTQGNRSRGTIAGGGGVPAEPYTAKTLGGA